MQDTQVPVDRNTLYEEVWANPVKVVAQQYGLSDVGLAKICKKLNIPIPSRGYWAKVKVGKIMRKIPLPALPPSALALTGPKPLSKAQRAPRVAVQDSIATAKESRPGGLTSPRNRPQPRRVSSRRSPTPTGLPVRPARPWR